ncbi:MATE family efflux transporter [Marasmitruncus massiliensis]|uniref:MATE family efflux transporter n=1 Tax=Marasmitruncus massiliensis TaxID=1944642 RepID=UPI0015E07122|nr:MATE family efflux transporter [Marasmitruncus massiliensis]
MQNTNFELMESAPVNKAILKLAIPTVLSTIIQLIYNLTDTYFIGLLDDPVQLAAISLAFPVFMMIQAVGNIVGSGAPSYISRSLGAKNYKEARHTSAVAFYSSAAIMVVMTGISLLFMNPILGLIGTSSTSISPTKDYLSVICGCSVILTMQIILPAMLRAEGKVHQAVTGMVIGTVTNIILDPLFILGFHMGAAGAAWATVIGNCLAVIYYLTVYTGGKSILSISPRDFKPSTRIYGEILKIGLPSSISQIVMSMANVLTNNLAASYGDNVISAFGVAGKLLIMVVMIVIGYVTGYMPFAGYNYGARNTHRLIQAFKFTILSGTAACFAFLGLFLFCGPIFMRVFTSQQELIDLGLRIMHAQAWSIPLMAVQMTMMVTFQATGQAIKATIVNLGRQCLLYLPLLYLFNALWQLSGLMYAQCVADILTTVTAISLGIPFLKKLYMMDKSLQPAAAQT